MIAVDKYVRNYRKYEKRSLQNSGTCVRAAFRHQKVLLQYWSEQHNIRYSRECCRLHRLGWVLNTRDEVGGKTSSWQTHQSRSLLDLSTARNLLGVSFITSLIYAHLWPQTALQKITYYVTHARHTTALQPNLFLTGIHRLLVTNKWRPSFPSPNNCQGHLQTTVAKHRTVPTICT